MPNKQENWRPISLPVTSETHKLFFSNCVTDKVNGSRVQPSLSGRNKDWTRESGGNRAYLRANSRKFALTVKINKHFHKDRENVFFSYVNGNFISNITFVVSVI